MTFEILENTNKELFSADISSIVSLNLTF
jgi:hypothetical protein